HIIYLGAKADVRPCIQRADVVVLPSYREGTPRSLLEAAAMAKPLLATDVAGCREVVKSKKNGLLCEVKNAQDLAKKMIEMIEMPQEVLKEMGKESRLLAENVFDEKNVFYHYEEAIRVLLAKKRK
ncbi:MAG: glycosyltransferase, partial [Thermonemataceae bacterium]|nr:glycosyltransferase [Thermonemataceae bacterium]